MFPVLAMSEEGRDQQCHTCPDGGLPAAGGRRLERAYQGGVQVYVEK